MILADSYPHHESIYLKDFTAFADCTFEFVPTINAFVGENGTGKTHLMKLLYAVQYSSMSERRQFAAIAIERVFAVEELGELVRVAEDTLNAVVGGTWGGATWDLIWQENRVVTAHKALEHKVTRPVFIPAIDMMGHTRRSVSTYDEYQIDFDQTHRDIVALLLSPERRNGGESSDITGLLTSVLGGSVEEQAERFYLKTEHGRLPMPLVAEGLRKIATLYHLIRNGLLGPGSVLFWDEPEVNVNPKFMDEIVDVLLRLTRTGVQIFLATHSYVLLKELDLQAKASDNVRYFGLETAHNGTVAYATDDYSQLHPNPIAEQFDSLYDRQLDRSLGRKRKS